MVTFSQIREAARTEVREALARPSLLFTGILWPLFLICVLVSIFASGLMRSLPVAVIDLDRTTISREIVLTLESLPSVKVERFETDQEALRAMRAGKVYASVRIPYAWSAHLVSRTGESAIELSFAKSYYAIATTLEVDIKSALNAKFQEIMKPYLSGTGGSLKGSDAAFHTLEADIFVPGNPTYNYSPFLLSSLIPCVFALSVILTMVGVYAREWREKRCHSYFAEGESVTAKLIGKSLPWLAFYSFAAVAYVAWFAGFMGYTPVGSTLVWVAGALLLIYSMAAFALCFVSCAPHWIIAMSVAIGFCAPILPFTGFSYPLDSMDLAANIFALILPLTWFLRIESCEWVLGSPLSHSLWLLGVQALFVLIPLFVGLFFFPKRVKGWIRKEAQEEKSSEAPPPNTLIGEIFEGVRRGIFSAHTCIIFIFAIAFYCCFYAWPYMHQSVTGIAAAITDLDRTSASRGLIQQLKSHPTLKVEAVDADPAKAFDLYRREDVSAVIEIPVDFEKNVLAGKHVTLAVTVNGFYTVKARAVQAAVLAVTMNEAKAPLAMNLNRSGTPTSRIVALSKPPVSLVDQNLFNSISGYASYTVPVVGPVILQAVLFMCVGMTLGGWLVRRPTDAFTENLLTKRRDFLLTLTGFILFGLFWFCYAEGLVFSLFDFPTMENFAGTICIMVLMLVGAVALGAVVTLLLGSNAYVAQCLVLISAPAVFLSGAIYPISGFGPLALLARAFLPTSPGVEAMIAVSQNGAALSDVSSAVLLLAVQAVGYVILADFLRKYRFTRLKVRVDGK